jgi:hypothetical protein
MLEEARSHRHHGLDADAPERGSQPESALSLGAQDYVPKPESTSEVTTSVDFRRELDRKGQGARRTPEGDLPCAARPDDARGDDCGQTTQPQMPARALPGRDKASRMAAAPAPVQAKLKTRPYSSARRASSRSDRRPADLRHCRKS